MRIAKGRVVGGHIVVEGEPLADGVDVTTIAEADRGETLDADEVLSQLRRG
jgi:hypothetical protein